VRFGLAALCGEESNGHAWYLAAVSAGLYEDGYTNIVNIDISDVIIRQMTVEHSDRYPLMTCTHPHPTKDHTLLPATQP
jgi:hypothetical protein